MGFGECGCGGGESGCTYLECPCRSRGALPFRSRSIARSLYLAAAAPAAAAAAEFPTLFHTARVNGTRQTRDVFETQRNRCCDLSVGGCTPHPKRARPRHLTVSVFYRCSRTTGKNDCLCIPRPSVCVLVGVPQSQCIWSSACAGGTLIPRFDNLHGCCWLCSGNICGLPWGYGYMLRGFAESR